MISDSLDNNQIVAEQGILRDCRENIEQNRKENFEFASLDPNQKYKIEQIENGFPFGTSIDSMRVVINNLLQEHVKKLIKEDPTRRGELEKSLSTYLKTCDKRYIKLYIETIGDVFNAIVPEEPFLWTVTDFDHYFSADAIVEYAKQNDLTRNFRGHCLFFNKVSHTPTRFIGKTPDVIKEDLKEEMKVESTRRSIEMVRRYPIINEWVVLNEASGREPRIKTERIKGKMIQVDRNAQVINPAEDIDFFVELFKKAKRANPKAKLLINEYSILNGELTDDYILLINELLARGAPIDGVGIQGHIRGDRFAYIKGAKEQIEKIKTLQLPIHITEFDVSNSAIKKAFPPDINLGTDSIEKMRARYVAEMMTLFYGTPEIKSIFLFGFQDKVHWRGDEGCGLFDLDFKPNHVGNAYIDLIHSKWRTSLISTSDRNGIICFRGFPGKYKITNQATLEAKVVEFEHVANT